MNPKWLQHQIEELQNHLTHFRKIQSESEINYKKLLELTPDPEQRSLLMERHLINMDRQEKAIAKIKKMYKEAVDRLSDLEKSD